MRISEISPGEKIDKTYIRPDPDIDQELLKSNPNLRFADIISAKCSEALAEMRRTGECLYRGIQNPSSRAFHGMSRTNRLPMMNNITFVHEFNAELRKMGIVANRINSISTTINRSIASDFGDALFYIFPINGFKFMWAEHVNDFGLFFSKYNVKPTKQMLEALGFSGSNFAAALQSGNEISIHGEYYAIEEDNNALKKYLGIGH